MPILEMRTATLKQKAIILAVLSRLCQDPQALVEIYLNYDCDGEAADNIYEQYVRMWFHLCRLIIPLVLSISYPSLPPCPSQVFLRKARILQVQQRALHQRTLHLLSVILWEAQS